MEQIKVGEYVRINNDFRLIALGIGKVINVNQDTIYVKMRFEMPFTFEKEKIIKHSPKIIDLIEEGDYVNGVEVQYVYGYDEDGNDLDGLGICEVDGDYAYYKYLEDITIHSIITKEQMKAMEYKIKE